MSVQSISKMGSLLDAVDKNMKTNLTFDDMLAITKIWQDLIWKWKIANRRHR